MASDIPTLLGSYLPPRLRKALQERQTATKLAGFWAKTTGGLVAAGFIVFAVLIFLLSTAALVRMVWAWVPPFETTGQIIIDSPKVYTRERLVNDRLEEASWLDSQLKETAEQLFKPQFRSVAGQLTTLKREELSIAAGADAVRTTKDVAKNAGETLSVEPTIDRFRDLHTFREEIRAEMMQTQLDDRHDLGGNTVYRLTFDTTIVAGPNTRKLAWIDVDITRQVTNEEKVEIFQDWKNYVEKETRRLLGSWLRSFMEYGLTPDDQLSIFSFFVNKICETPPSEECHKVILKFIDWYTENEQRPKKNYVKNALKNVKISTSFDNIYAQYNEFCYSSIRLSKENQSNIIFYLPRSWTEATDKGIPCQPPGTALSAIPFPYYRLFAIVDLYDRVQAHRTKDSTNKLGYDDIKKQCGSRNNDRLKNVNPLHQFVVHKIVPIQIDCEPLVPWKYSETIRCAIAQYTRDFLDKNANQLNNYFIISIEGKGTISCNISIHSNTNSPEHKLANRLALDVTTFSYAVTPRNMMQRLGVVSSDDDILSIISDSKPDEKLASQAIALLQERGKKLEIAQGFPVIVGLGSNEPSSPGFEGNAVAHFGWVIAPAMRGGSDYSATQYVQTTQQYTLAAVISVPSWWRRVRVTYRACWVDPRDFRLMLWRSSLQCSSIRKKWWGIISLPGKIDEISRTLGFLVRNEPNLDENQKWELTAGKKQAVVIRGARLWRSTAVTLGFQKADKIEVLPNMNGIIATFNCVQEHSGSGPPKLQVWTSEGATPPQDVAIAPSMGRSSCSDDDKPISVKPKTDAPSLDDGQQWTLTAGRKQTMVVRGKRLWYGTVVTLGSQKADAIELLPGSNGVIATFDCLQEPEGPTMLQAWTSEGVTSPISVAIASSGDGQQCSKQTSGESRDPSKRGPT